MADELSDALSFIELTERMAYEYLSTSRFSAIQFFDLDLSLRDVFSLKADILIELGRYEDAIEEGKKGLLISTVEEGITNELLGREGGYDDVTIANNFIQNLNVGLSFNTYFEPMELYQRLKHPYSFAFRDYANLLIDAKQYQKGLDMYSIIDWDFVPNKQYIGKAYYYLGDYSAALKSLNEFILSESPLFENVYKYRGYTKMELGDYVGAIIDLKASIDNDIKIDKGEIKLSIGEVYLKIDQIEEGCNYLREAMDLNVPNALDYVITYCQ